MQEVDAHYTMQRAEGSCRVEECLRAHGRQKPAIEAIKGLGHGAMGLSGKVCPLEGRC